jgi:hypothetical protein
MDHILVSTAGNDALRLRCSTDNGSTYDTAANYARVLAGTEAAGLDAMPGNSSASSVSCFLHDVIGDDANEEFSCYAFMAGHTVATRPTHLIALGFYFNDDQDAQSFLTGGIYKNDAVVNAVQFSFANAGNFVTGEIRMYGLRGNV